MLLLGLDLTLCHEDALVRAEVTLQLRDEALHLLELCTGNGRRMCVEASLSLRGLGVDLLHEMIANAEDFAPYPKILFGAHRGLPLELQVRRLEVLVVLHNDGLQRL